MYPCCISFLLYLSLCLILLVVLGILTVYLLQPKCKRLCVIRPGEARRSLVMLLHLVRIRASFGTTFLIQVLRFTMLVLLLAFLVDLYNCTLDVTGPHVLT